MTNEQIDILVNRILSGVLIFEYKGIFYELRSPTPLIKYQSCLLYEQIINDEKYNDWIKDQNLSHIMTRLGLWNPESDKMITSLEKKVEDLKLKLYESLNRPDLFKLNKKTIASTRKSLNVLNTQKSNFRNNTLEGYAESAKGEFVICKTLYDNKGERLFDDDLLEDQSSVSYNFFNGLIQQVYSKSISTADMRELARSSQWRAYWNANKENVFPGSVSEWTDDQRLLVGYSRMYDSVYEHPDSPNEKVIDDDDVLDGWFIFQKKKIEREKKQSSKTASYNGKNMDKAQEVFLFVDKDQSFDDIMELNDPSAKMRMKQKINYVKQKGEAKDSELPDVKVEIANQRAEMMRSRQK